jgi:hypothetical protein
MAHEIVRAKLLLGIQAVLFQVLRPLRELRPPGRDKVRVAFRVRDGIAENQHVAAFLHGHALASVIAAGDERIRAQIVRRVRKLPGR